MGPPSWQWFLEPLRSQLSLDLTQMLRLIPGTDTTDTDTGRTDMDTMDMATDTDTTMERGLLMLSPLLMLLPVLRLRPIPGTDTTDTATGLTAMDTMATDLTVMPTGVKLRPTTTSCFSLPTLL